MFLVASVALQCSICNMKQNTHVFVQPSRFKLLKGEELLTSYRVRGSGGVTVGQEENKMPPLGRTARECDARRPASSPCQNYCANRGCH